jgi:hypothetical protein
LPGESPGFTPTDVDKNRRIVQVGVSQSVQKRDFQFFQPFCHVRIHIPGYQKGSFGKPLHLVDRWSKSLSGQRPLNFCIRSPFRVREGKAQSGIRSGRAAPGRQLLHSDTYPGGPLKCRNGLLQKFGFGLVELPLGCHNFFLLRQVFTFLTVFIITEHRQRMNKLLLRGFLANLGMADCGEHEVLEQHPDGYRHMGHLAG